MKTLLLLLALSTCSVWAGAQTFKKYYGGKNTEYGQGITATADGGFAVIGSSNSTGNRQLYLLKIDAQGQQVWQTNFGGKSYEEGNSLKTTTDGGFILCGMSKSFSPTYEGDVYVIKTDSLGKEEWAQHYGTEKAETGLAIALTHDGGYVVSGNAIMPDRWQDIYVIKLNAKGSEEWHKTFSATSTYSAEATGVVVTPKGSIVIAGAIQNGKGYNNTLIQLGALRDSSWQRNTGGEEANHLQGISYCSDSGFIVCGTMGGGTGNAFIMKTNKYGNRQWSKNMGVPENRESFSAVIETKDKNYVAVGSTTTGKGHGKTDVYLVKFNSQGKILWEKYHGTAADDYGTSLLETSDGFIITGNSLSDPANAEQILIYKTNATGDVEP